ncbi:MAG: hypothetical protein ABSD27_10190 [Bryobacteraceae bacterium]|jgi:hypothetical protein
MNLFSRVHLTLQQSLAILLALVLCQQSLAQKSGGPDKLIEANRYAAFATDALNCRGANDSVPRDPVAEAIKWTQRAITTAKELRTSDKDERGRAAAFIARQTRQLTELEGRQARFDTGAKSMEKALKQARLLSAQRVLRETEPLACDARFETLTTQLDGELRRFSELIADADSVVETEPQAAISKYEEARSANVESPEITQKIMHARRVLVQHQAAQKARIRAERKVRVGSRTAKSVAWIVVLVGLLGGLGYAAYEQNKKKKQ